MTAVETIRCRHGVVDRRGWEEGPWQREPDVGEWTDPGTGFVCKMMRGQDGAWAGYVGLPIGHRYWGRDFAVVPSIDEVQLDYTRLDGDGTWYFGFMFTHYHDLIPLHAARLGRNPWPTIEDEILRPIKTYKDMPYTIRCVRELAAVLAV